MALNMISRSVVKKVLAVETPEVCLFQRLLISEAAAYIQLVGCWSTRTTIHRKRELAQFDAFLVAGSLPCVRGCRKLISCPVWAQYRSYNYLYRDSPTTPIVVRQP